MRWQHGINPAKLWLGAVETLASIRSGVEPLLIFHQFGPYAGIEGQAFRRRMSYWRNPSVDAILWALDCLHELKYQERLQQTTQTCRGELLTFLVNNFVSEDGIGGFRQCDTAPPTVYASWAGINVLRYIHNQPYYAYPREPLGYERAIKLQRMVERVGPW